MTPHFKQHYIRVYVSLYGIRGYTLWLHSGQYALCNEQNEYATIPLFVAYTLTNNKYEVGRGPFIFKNGFDKEPEAQYLIQMMQFSKLAASAAAKIDHIRQQYADWISYDIEVTEILRKYINWL